MATSPNKTKKSKSDDQNIDINSAENRVVDFFKMASKDTIHGQGVYSQCVNPHNVKLLTQMAISKNKNPLWEFIYEDLLEKADKAILENKNISLKDVHCISDISTSAEYRNICADDFMKEIKKQSMSPLAIQRVLAYAPKEYHVGFLENMPWNTPVKLQKDDITLLSYALKKKSKEVVLKKLEEITESEMANLIKEINPIKNLKHDGEDRGSWNMDSMSYLIVDQKNYTTINTFLSKFGHLLDFENKQPFMIILGSRIFNKLQIVEKKAMMGEKILKGDFSKEEYDFVKILDGLVSKSERKRTEENEFHFYTRGLDFITVVLQSEVLKSKFEDNASDNTLNKPSKRLKP